MSTTTTTARRAEPDPAERTLIDRAWDRALSFNLAVLDNPAMLDEIPNGVVLVLLSGNPADDEYQIGAGLVHVRGGRDVWFRRWPPVPRDPSADPQTPTAPTDDAGEP